jgi:hypothetical protein
MRFFVTAGTNWTLRGVVETPHSTDVRVQIGYVVNVPSASGAKQTLPDPEQQRFALQKN